MSVTNPTPFDLARDLINASADAGIREIDRLLKANAEKFNPDLKQILMDAQTLEVRGQGRASLKQALRRALTKVDSSITAKPAPHTYSDAQKIAVVNWVNAYNADHGRGGQAEAAKHFGVGMLTISLWLKQAIKKTQPTLKLPIEVLADKVTTERAADPEVTTERPKDPAWDGVRQTLVRVQNAGREYLYGKAWLGWQLFMLKKASGVHRGKKKSDSLSDFRTWADIVKEELDIHERTANRLIEKFEAVKAKAKRSLKTLPGGKNTLTIFQSENPLALPPEQMEAMLKIVTSLCDGETEASLMEELKIIPTPAPPPAGKKEQRGAKLTPEQLAFDFFDGPASAICRARASAEYKKLLYMLPAVTDEEGQVSLTFLRDEIGAMLEDVNEALAAHAKPANKKA